MNVRTVLFAASRKYFAMMLVVLACYATSFIAAYLLPVAVVCLAASLLFAGGAMLCQVAPKNTVLKYSVNPRPPSDTAGVSTIKLLGVKPAERN